MPIGNNRRILDCDDGSRPAPVFNLAKSINFDYLNDSNNAEVEADDKSIVADSSLQFAWTPCRSVEKAQFWDSGLGSPTPGSSPVTPSKSTRNFTVTLSPIPFSYEDSEETNEAMLDSSITGQENSVHNESGFSFVPQTPGEDTPTPTRRTQLSPNNLNPKLHRSMKKMKLEGSPVLFPSSNYSFPSRQNRVCNFSSRKSLARSIIAQPSRNSADCSGPQMNTNPFVSNDLDVTKCTSKAGTKRCRDRYEADAAEKPCKKFSLQDINTSRFREEFVAVNCIGKGHFGSVYKCINRLDGCTYAIKKSKAPIVGSNSEKSALNEVYAHAILGKHLHIVGYYSSWIESNHIFIQNEYCNGGSLSDLLDQLRRDHKSPTELELYELLVQLAEGLGYIHSHNLAHLDLKPDNVLVCFHQRQGLGYSDDGTSFNNSLDVTYKIGDFGMVTSIITPVINEGDCRYLPKEILRDKIVDLQKADIFSLSLTVFEMGSGLEMPLNGNLWHEYRVVGLPNLKHIAPEFNSLIKSMAAEDPASRPTATEVVRLAWVASPAQKTNMQLNRELVEQKRENEKLQRKLEELLATKRNNRLIGRLCFRSQSML